MKSEAIEPVAAYSIAESTNQLRYVRREGRLVLQQNHLIRSICNSIQIDCHGEWRDVPIVGEVA